MSTNFHSTSLQLEEMTANYESDLARRTKDLEALKSESAQERAVLKENIKILAQNFEQVTTRVRSKVKRIVEQSEAQNVK